MPLTSIHNKIPLIDTSRYESEGIKKAFSPGFINSGFNTDLSHG